MAERNFQLKLVFSAFAGFLVASILVIIIGDTCPGIPRCMVPALKAYTEVCNHYDEHPPKLADELNQQSAWLAAAKKEADSWPFLLAISFLAPSVLIFRRL